jgi:hypothetical protein
MSALIQAARNASPYLLIELLLPGGSVIALALWLFRRYSKKGALHVQASADLGIGDARRLCAGGCA